MARTLATVSFGATFESSHPYTHNQYLIERAMCWECSLHVTKISGCGTPQGVRTGGTPPVSATLPHRLITAPVAVAQREWPLPLPRHFEKHQLALKCQQQLN